MGDFDFFFTEHSVRHFFFSHLLWIVLGIFFLSIFITLIYDLFTEDEKPVVRTWKTLSELKTMECEDLRSYIIKNEGFYLKNVGEAKEIFKYKGCKL